MRSRPCPIRAGALVRGLAALAVFAAQALAQALPSPLPPSNPAPIVYCPPERLAAGAPAPQHVLNVFLPRGQRPAKGWPVVVATGYGGGNAVPPLANLTRGGQSAPLWNLVSAGIAVVQYGTPGLSARRGLWYPPGHPSGRYESFLPANDNPEKSAVWALQWVRVQTLYPFDLTRIGLRGSSGGAVLAIRTAMGPERASATGSAHVRASTRVAAILAIQPPTSAWALEQGPALTIAFPGHLEQSARPGVPATELSQVAAELQKDYSLMREAFVSPAARANNAAQAICLVYGDPVLRIGGQVATMALDASGFPVLHDAIVQPLQHDSWFGYVFWQRLLDLSPAARTFHEQNSMFAMRDVNALAPPLATHTRTYTGTVMAAAATKLGHDWLVARLKAGLQVRAQEQEWEPPVPTVPASVCPETSEVALVQLEGPDADGRLVLALRAPQGSSALVSFHASAPSGWPCGGGGFTRLGRPHAVSLGAGPGAWDELVFQLGPDALDTGVQAQALVFRAGRAAPVRLGLSAGLALTR